MEAMKIEYPYLDLPSHCNHLSPIQKAMAQHFGIAMGWNEEECPHHPGEALAVLNIVCIPCENGIVFYVASEQMDKFKGGAPIIEEGQYQKLEQHLSCQHLEQFRNFREGLKDGHEYEESLLEVFSEKAGEIR